MKLASWRSLISLLVLFVSLVYALPNIPMLSNSSLMQYLPQSKINLGLDLKGGVSLTLGVQVEKAYDNLLSLAGQDVREISSQNDILVLQARLVDSHLELVLPKNQDITKFSTLFAENFPDLALLGHVVGENEEYIYSVNFTDEYKAQLETEILDQAVKTVRNRIDQFGVAEPDIRKQAGNRIQVQLPGLDDPQRAIQLLGQTASLTFHLVRDDVDPSSFMLPSGTALFPVRNDDGTLSDRKSVLDTAVLMTGVDITDARPNYGERGEIGVGLELNSRGADDFEKITGDHVGKRIAIVLDGTVFSAPMVNERIAGGRAHISGSASVQEAQDLSIILRSGALPAPVEVLEERTVGPSLGQESINSGLLAALVGALAVIVIMPIYYGFSGIIANIMLCFTMLLVTAGLGLFGATLTLPGIAGIVLTIGMAVDANVLIYERIREEIAKGLTALEAVQSGFARATISIMDSNITTMLAAVVLYQFGSGPVRGFAVTLAIGILASMFTAVFVSRDIFLTIARKRDRLSI